MAKKESTASATLPSPVSTEAPKAKVDLKPLFLKADTAHDAMTKAQEAYHDAIAAIVVVAGNGPFNRNGKRFKAWKNVHGKYYFREDTVESIDV